MLETGTSGLLSGEGTRAMHAWIHAPLLDSTSRGQTQPDVVMGLGPFLFDGGESAERT
jgi:hypothetical protein